jgi:hypothetical protein
MSNLFDENDIINVSTGGQVWFGMNGETLWEPDSTVLEYDIIRGTTTLAPMVLRGTDAHFDDGNPTVMTQRFTNTNRVFPLIEDLSVLTAEQITKVMAGERRGGSLTQQERMRVYAKRLHRANVMRCFRTQEYLAWQVILTGTMPAITGTTNSDLIYDFKRNSNHAITPAAAWSNAATDIMGDLDTGWDLINQNAHIEAQILMCGVDGMKYIKQNTDIQSYADNRRYSLMNIGDAAAKEIPTVSQLIANGYQYHGYISTLEGNKFYLFTYKKFYESGGTIYRYLPDNKVVMTSVEVVADKVFGPGDGLPPSQQEIADYRDIMGVDITQAPGMSQIDTGTQTFDPRWYTFGLIRNRKNLELYTQVAPIYVPKQTDGWVVYTVS